VLPSLYDDGGYSGGNMERPALQRLIAEIEAGKVDVIVVYKVDRLTRALSDFAKLVEIFDRRGVSFVSITQQFNTTTSMGRLTLNMLLSFAQFEREIIGERVRDKIAASKKKGMWMGGMPPLGYDVKDRKLVVNKHEATSSSDTWHLSRFGISRRSLRPAESRASAGFGLTASFTADGDQSPGAHSISCFRIASTAARSSIRATHIQESIRRLSIRVSGIRSSRLSRLIGLSERPAQTPSNQTFWVASCLTPPANG